MRAWSMMGIAVLGLLCWPLSHCQGDEPSGLQAAIAIESALVKAIAKAEKSVVAISRVRRDLERDPQLPDQPPLFNGGIIVPNANGPGEPDFVPNQFGTGVIIDRNGVILTHYQVLGTDSDLYITTCERKTFHASVVAADPRSELAVLSIDAKNLTPIQFGNAAELKKGQIVIALGNPYAIARDGQASASWGIVSNLQRKAEPDPARVPKTLAQLGALIQTDAKLNLGTSGGALLNLQGEMIGLTTSMAAAAGYEQAAGYALPVDAGFLRIVETLKQGREVEYGFLGVNLRAVARKDKIDGVEGSVVGQVVANFPAAKGGMAPADVVTRYNDQPIVDPDQLMLEIARTPPGTKVQLAVNRQRTKLSLAVSLAKAYPSPGKIVTQPAPAWRGIRVDYATASPRAIVAINDIQLDSKGCVIITEVEPESPAWKAGLRPDQYLSKVGSRQLESPADFWGAVKGKTGSVTLSLPLANGRYEEHVVPVE